MNCKNYIEHYPYGFPRCKVADKICYWNNQTMKNCPTWREQRKEFLQDKIEGYCCTLQEGSKLTEAGQKRLAKLNKELGELCAAQFVHKEASSQEGQ